MCVYGSVGVGSCEGRLQDCVQGAEWAAEMRASLYRQRNQSYPGWTLTSALNYSHVSDPKTKMLGILQEGGQYGITNFPVMFVPGTLHLSPPKPAR